MDSRYMIDTQIILNSGSRTVGKMEQMTTELPYETLTFREGEVLFKEGENPKGLYYVQSGCVKIIVHREQIRGRTTTPDYVTKLVSPGEFFGYKALIKGTASQTSAKAVKNTVVWLYPKELIMAALQQTNPLLKMLLSQTVQDIESFEQTNQLHYLASVQERIAYQLLHLSNKFGVETPQGVSINLKLTRNEFAQLASTINESLSRHLTDFKEEGLIDLNGKEIIIKNRPALIAKSGSFR